MKICKSCEEPKEEGLGEFPKDLRLRGGFASTCKECAATAYRLRRGMGVKLLHTQSPITPEEQLAINKALSYKCRVFVTEGAGFVIEVFKRGEVAGQCWPMEEWLAKFEGRWEEL